MSTTFTIIKPQAVKQYSGLIIHQILEAGFNIIALKMIHLSKSQAQEFYKVHAARPFYNDLVSFMITEPVIVAVLQKDNAVDDYRKLIGNTDPSKAEDATIRKLYASSIQANAVHGSDSDANAEIESSFFFPTIERFPQ